MSDNPWDDMSGEEFTEDDRKKQRYYQKMISENETHLRRIFTIMRAWWLFGFGVAAAATGWLTKLVEKYTGGLQ